jgi:hypothetical protein
MNVILALLLSQIAVHDEGVRVGSVRNLNFTGPGVTCTSGPLRVTCDVTSGGGGGAPTPVPYWVGAADATLSAEINLGALGTGLVLNTGGTPSIYGGTGSAPANQWLRSLSASGVATWAQVDWTDLSGVPATFPATVPVSTASALASDPTACGAGTYVSDISAAGALTCGTPAGTYSLPALTATVLGGVKGNGSTLLCSGTDKMTGFDAAGAMQCAADQTGGGGGWISPLTVAAFKGF